MTLHFHPVDQVRSWGRVLAPPHLVARPGSLAAIDAWTVGSREPRLATGARRSYGDVCLLEGGRLIDMSSMDRFRSFDAETGVLVAEAGVTIDAILSQFVPRGWFVPVTPGTRHVTLGGAIANDVHGKNHASAGTFGCHVRRIVIERSDEGRVTASPDERPELFAATIGGLGLTGIIVEVELALQRIPSAMLDVETFACGNLDRLCDRLEAGFAAREHNVAWIDCTASGAKLGRGIVSQADWAAEGGFVPHGPPRRSVPTDRVAGLLNPLTLKLFNAGYNTAGRLRAGRHTAHYAGFLYPLDAISGWNRLYGPHGFYQYQCMIPTDAGREPLRDLLRIIAASGEGSLLAVLKLFGARRSPGLLSFPQPGFSLALDFRNRGAATLQLLERLDAVTTAAGGRLYPAKDQRMPAALFRQGYPALDRFEASRDPACLSDFWKRVAA